MRYRSLTVHLTFALSALPLFSTVHVARAAAPSIERIRYSLNEDRTRIVIDCSRPFPYKIVRFHDPERIAVNLADVKAPDILRGISIDRGVVSKVRINRLSWGSQVVFDLRSGAAWNDFALGKTDSKPDRIVLDVRKSSLSPVASAPERRSIVVAIDPGHGGRQPGTIGKYKLVEKEVALDIAVRVARRIDKQEGYSAVLTRSDDRYLAFEERTEIARQRGADAFVSIHLNSAPSGSARGVEVFFLSPSGAQAKASKLLSDKDEATRELGLDEPQSDDVLTMILDMNQQSMMLRSSMLAEELLTALRSTPLPAHRGIKQRSYAVLKTVTMPSVLVEAGFLSNSQDARILRTASGKEDIAKAIADGIVSFFKQNPPPRGESRKVLVHEVRRGDSLWKIAKTYKTTISNLRKANRLGSSSTLRVGQKIIIFEGR
jgi:N-acetylmuramoyl-L-alanine amidase